MMDVVLLIVFLPLCSVVNVFFFFSLLPTLSPFMLSSFLFRSTVPEFVALNSVRTSSDYIF